MSTSTSRWLFILDALAAENIRDIVNGDNAKVLKWKKLDVGEFKCNIDDTMFQLQSIMVLACAYAMIKENSFEPKRS